MCNFPANAFDGFLQRTNESELLAQHETMVRPDGSNQRFSQLSTFGLQSSPRQVCQGRRIGLPGQQSFEHVPCRLAHDIGGHIYQFEIVECPAENHTMRVDK